MHSGAGVTALQRVKEQLNTVPLYSIRKQGRRRASDLIYYNALALHGAAIDCLCADAIVEER